MAEKWIYPDQVFDGHTLKTGVAVGLHQDVVTKLIDAAAVPVGTKLQNVAGTLTPGFVDLQVNGGGGVLVNHAPSKGALQEIANAHRQLGTVAIMPTVITDAPDVMAAAADAAIAAREFTDIIGLHIEGPHISMARRGTHHPDHVRPFDDRTLGVVQRLCAAGVKTKMTLAPEVVSTTQIEKLVQMGAIVSLGHTDADAGQMRSAFGAGASCVTHLFNAMSQMVGRAPGAVGSAINSDAYLGIICDGHHVDDAMIGLAIRARREAGKMFLVSDAMPTVGGASSFDLYGNTIRVKAGKLVNSDGNLAGAHLTMADAVSRLVHTVGIDLQTALQMAITVPAKVVNTPHLSTLMGRRVHDLVILDHGLALTGSLAAQLG